MGVASLGQKRAVRGVVLDTNEVGSGAARDLAPAVAEDRRSEGFGDDGAFAVVVLRQHVSDLRSDGERAVRGERPGGRRPSDEGGPWRSPKSVVVAESRQSRGRRAVRHGLRFLRGEADVDAGVGGVLLVAEGDLVGAEARDATGAVGRHLVALVDKALVPEALEHPPCRFDIGVVVGDVGVLHVQPDAGAVGHGLPFADVAEDALAAAAVELFDAELLDLLLAGDAELFLNLQLDREAVRVPSATAQGPEAAHGLVAEDDVLERAGEDVVDAGAAVRRGRPLVEDEQRGIRALAVDAVRQVGLAPCFEDRGLQLREVHLAGDGFIPFLRVASHAPPFCKKENAHPRTGGRTLPWYHHHSYAPSGARALWTSRRARMRAEGCRCNGRTARPRLLVPRAGKVRAVAQEGYSAGRTHRLAPYPARSARGGLRTRLRRSQSFDGSGRGAQASNGYGSTRRSCSLRTPLR